MRNTRHRSPILERLKFPKTVRRPLATEQEAREMDKEVVRIVGEIRSNWLRLGLLVQKFMVTQAYEALGFPNVHIWMKARFGESLSGMFSALRSVRALEGVSEEKLKRIGERNAHMLTYLPEKERKSEEWIEKAATLPTRDFNRVVRAALEKKKLACRRKHSRRGRLPYPGPSTKACARPRRSWPGRLVWTSRPIRGSAFKSGRHGRSGSFSRLTNK
jgi:hypothetical protein